MNMKKHALENVAPLCFHNVQLRWKLAKEWKGIKASQFMSLFKKKKKKKPFQKLVISLNI